MSPHLMNGLSALQKRLKINDKLELELASLANKYGRGTADEDWIHRVAVGRDCVVTKDVNIKHRKQQFELIRRHNLSMIFVKRPSKKSTYWGTVMQLIKAWPEIRRLICIALDSNRCFELHVQPNGKVSDVNYTG